MFNCVNGIFSPNLSTTNSFYTLFLTVLMYNKKGNAFWILHTFHITSVTVLNTMTRDLNHRLCNTWLDSSLLMAFCFQRYHSYNVHLIGPNRHTLTYHVVYSFRLESGPRPICIQYTIHLFLCNPQGYPLSSLLLIYHFHICFPLS